MDKLFDPLRAELQKRCCVDPNGRDISILTFCNLAYVRLTHNLYLTLQRIDLEQYLVIVCSDLFAAEYLVNRGIPCLHISGDAPPGYAGNESIDDYLPHGIFKTRMLSEAVKGDVDVFFLDSDVAVARNPFPVFDTPVAAQIDDPIASGVERHANLGCIVFRATPEVREILNPDEIVMRESGAEQLAINIRMDLLGTAVTLLPRADYPNGETWLTRPPGNPKLIHFNYIHGRKNKYFEYQLAELWLVPQATIRVQPKGDRVQTALVLLCGALVAWALDMKFEFVLDDPSVTVEAVGEIAAPGAENLTKGTCTLVPENSRLPGYCFNPDAECFFIRSDDAFVLDEGDANGVSKRLRHLRTFATHLYRDAAPAAVPDLEWDVLLPRYYSVFVVMDDADVDRLFSMINEIEFGSA